MSARDEYYELAETLSEIREVLAGKPSFIRDESSFLLADQALIEAEGALQTLGEFVNEVDQDLQQHSIQVALPEKSKQEEYRLENCPYIYEHDFPGEELESYEHKQGK